MANREKQVQIPEKLLVGMYRLITALELQDNIPEVQNIANELEIQIRAKFDGMTRRELYTKSKTADDADAREKARLEYLEKVGMNSDWRY